MPKEGPMEALVAKARQRAQDRQDRQETKPDALRTTLRRDATPVHLLS